MQCPLCKTEMRIKSNDYVLNDGKLFSKMVYTCRNKKCANYNMNVATEYEPLSVTEDPDAKE